MTEPRNPFDPNDGEFAKNIRSITGLDDSELRESLKRFGWLPELPALADENDVVLVGHRRIRLAKQIGIEPVIKKLRVGSGSEADAKRFALAIASNLGHAPMTKDDRKRIAEYLYGKKEWTMERIAEALNVHHATIVRDLGNLCNVHKSKPAKTASNPKGAGRPKGRKGTAKPRNKTIPEEDRPKLAWDVLDHGKTIKETAADAGVSEQIVKTAVHEEKGRRQPQIARADLSMTAQEKLDAAIRQHKRKLDMEFEERCREDCRRWLNEVSLPQYTKELAELERSIRSRKGIMDSITFRKIRACLHPDRVQDPALKKRYEEAFRLFTQLEKRVLDEKESPTDFRPMPRTYEDLMVMKAKVKAARQAKRAGKSTMSVR